MPGEGQPDTLHARVLQLEEELAELQEQERKGRVSSEESREVHQRIRDLERDLEELRAIDLHPSGRMPIEAPSSLRMPPSGDASGPPSRDPPASWVDPGQGAPRLTTLLIGFIFGGLILVTVWSKCQSVGPHGAYRPTVQQHLNPVPHPPTPSPSR